MAGGNNEKIQDKYKRLHRGTSTNQIKNKIKERFLSTLKDVRRRSIDARRFSSSESTEKIFTIQDLQAILSENRDLKEIISTEEIDDIFNEVQKELGWIRGEESDLHSAEIQAIVENLMTYCVICDQSSDREICESCGNKYFTDSLDAFQY